MTLKQEWRDSQWLVLVELGIVAALFVADVYGFILLSKTPFLFLLGWLSLRLRGLRWSDAGFAAPQQWGRSLAFGILAGCGFVLLEVYVSYPLLERLTGQPVDLTDLRPLIGNLKLLIVGVVMSWILAGLGEELVYRGYLMNRLAGLAGGTRSAWIGSLLAVSFIFGMGHIDQGISGMIENTFAGFLLGLLYLACGRNLVVPIVAHGVGNMLDLILIYFDRYPGL